MKEDQMWIDIGPEKTGLLKRYGFDIVGVEFVKRGKSEPWILTFDHVRDTPIGNLRAELS
jgi:hypothetical protein